MKMTGRDEEYFEFWTEEAVFEAEMHALAVLGGYSMDIEHLRIARANQMNTHYASSKHTYTQSIHSFATRQRRNRFPVPLISRNPRV